MVLKLNNKKYTSNLTKSVSEEAKFFLEPQNPKQRQYEALRAYLVENIPAKIIAGEFGYSTGAFHALCHQFRNDPERNFFVSTKRGPKYGIKRDRSKERIIELRKQNYSVKDIQLLLMEEGLKLSTVWIWNILDEEGFSKLPRRKDEERPSFPRPERASYADVRQLCLAPRVIQSRIGGVFLLMKILTDMQVASIAKSLNWYGSKMIPPENAFLSCLLIKLIGKKRKSHVMDLVFDEGAALAVGLNEVPKTAYISEYSERITHEDNVQFMHKWLKRLRKTNVVIGESFNLDFQSLPYYGQEDVVEKHYVSMRSRRQKAILVFFAQDAQSKIFCYSNADLRKGEESEEIFRFIEFWEKQTGKQPPHLVFDSKLTTDANLSKLNNPMKITFITLRRRSPYILKEIINASVSAWRKITLKNVARKYRNPKVIDKEVYIKNYAGPIRQIFVKDLGYELPTVLPRFSRKKGNFRFSERFIDGEQGCRGQKCSRLLFS
ncbi:MAG: hypothetical protein ABH952_06770 [Candidatus Omnitrophota bacterium]